MLFTFAKLADAFNYYYYYYFNIASLIELPDVQKPLYGPII